MRISLTLLLLCVLVGQTVFGLDSRSLRPAYDHLYEINREWTHHRNASPEELVSFPTDRERITYHLKLVVATLRREIPEGVEGNALKNRMHLLDELETYAEQGIFPSNLYHKERTPYFIDDFGVHCAVGYLIMRSGHGDLSNRIRDEHNYDYLHDIRTPGVGEWAAEHGFVFGELAWIQPGYMSQQAYTQVGGGTDSTVTAMCRDDLNGRIIFAGDFAEIDGSIPCNGIGYYKDGQMYCMGNGLDGVINDIYVAQGTVYVSGLLNDAGTMYSIASFNGTQWSYENIPGREGMEAIRGINGSTNFAREIILKNDQGNNEHEIWRQIGSGAWELQATVPGPVLGMAISETQIAYGGHFDQFTAHLPGGDQTITSKNACLRDLAGNNWIPLTGQVADTVLVVRKVGSEFIFGGIAKFIDQWSPCNAMSAIHADSLAALYGTINLRYDHYTDSLVIVRDIAEVGTTSFAFCGEFTTGFMYFGSNVDLGDFSDFHTNAGLGYPYLTLSNFMGAGNGMGEFGTSPIMDVEVFDDRLYIGGLFTYSFNSPSQNLATVDFSVGLESQELPEFTVYPNPADEVVSVKADQAIGQLSILDMHGRPVLEQAEGNSLDISTLSGGNYLLKVVFSNGRIAHRKLMVR